MKKAPSGIEDGIRASPMKVFYFVSLLLLLFRANVGPYLQPLSVIFTYCYIFVKIFKLI